ncbi:MAG: hypothetical protein JNM72_18695 [Deltaproteobacteria bacterium]|nr:hypothetical protein [Deltaproteobacteria bacterium]
MSDPKQPTPPVGAPPQAPDLGDDDVIQEDALFKARMALANFVLGYWRYGAGALVAILVAAFIYGQVTERSREAQRDQHAQIERVMDKLAGTLAGAADEAAADAALKAAATELEGVLPATEGVAAAYGWMRLAQLKDNVKDEAGAAAAWTEAANRAGGGPIGLSAALRASAAKAKAGDVDGAVALLAPYTTSKSGFEAEEALYGTGLAYLAGGRPADAKATVEKLRLRFPEGPRLRTLEAALPKVEG